MKNSVFKISREEGYKPKYHFIHEQSKISCIVMIDTFREGGNIKHRYIITDIIGKDNDSVLSAINILIDTIYTFCNLEL